MQEVRNVDVPPSTSQEQLQTPNEVVLDAVGEGTPEAQSEEVLEAEAGEHHEAFLGLDSYGWVGIAFAIFLLLLIWKKVPHLLTSALDGRANTIRAELDEARALRAEAEALLAEQKRKAEQSAKDAEAILANAQREAGAIVAEAETTAAAMVQRRQEAAETKIAAAERAAERDLRARVAALSTDAARRVIADQTDPAARQAMTDRAISDLGTRLN